MKFPQATVAGTSRETAVTATSATGSVLPETSALIAFDLHRPPDTPSLIQPERPVDECATTPPRSSDRYGLR